MVIAAPLAKRFPATPLGRRPTAGSLTVFPAKLLTEILQRHYKERAFTRCAIMLITDAKALGSSEVDRNSVLKHSPHPSSRKNIGPNTPETRAVVLAMLSRKMA